MTGPSTPLESGDSYDAESSLAEETVALPGERGPAEEAHGEDPGAHAGEDRPVEDGGTAPTDRDALTRTSHSRSGSIGPRR